MHIPGSTVLLLCSCKSEFEDERYGKGRRVHNCMGKGAVQGKAIQARCAQCRTERPIARAA